MAQKTKTKDDDRHEVLQNIRTDSLVNLQANLSAIEVQARREGAELLFEGRIVVRQRSDDTWQLEILTKH
jgi:hypothetical protein